MNIYTSNSTLCCHWCEIPLGNATQVTYLNGNLPICDLCLGTSQAQILSALAEKDKRIAELEEQVEKRKCCGNCKWYKQGYTDGQRHNKLCLQAAKGEKNWPI